MTKPRRRDRLINRRKQMGFTREGLAQALHVSPKTVEGWELGTRTPSPGIRRLLAELLEVSLAGLDLLLSADGPKLQGHAVPPGLSLYDSLVHDAGCLELFAQVTVPSLLQTRPYARVVESLGLPPTPTARAEELADYRLVRQEALDCSSKPLRLRAVLHASVLTEEVGSRETTLGQIEHLAVMAERPNVEILVMPPKGGCLYCTSSYELLYRPQVDGTIEPEPFIAFTFNPSGIIYHVSDLDSFIAMKAYVDHAALPADESLRWIHDTMEKYR